MKKRLLLVLILLTSAIQGFSQTKGISYQAVILNPNPQEIPGQNAQGNILANSAVSLEFSIINSSGTEEYQEKHSTRTDRYGMINLLIGSGTKTSSNSFTDIFWDGTVKKLKVAIDFTGGSNFSPLSEQNLTYMPQPATQETTQLILDNAAAILAETARAKFAEQTNAAGIALNTGKVGITSAQASDITINNAKVGVTGAQATKLAGIADGAEVNVQADWNQATTTADDYIKNKPTIPAAADGSETKVTAGTNVTLTGTGTTASPYVLNATGGSGAALTIGQSYQGGKIFWLDATGQHGLIAATADQSTGIQWDNGVSKLTGTTGDGLYAGAMNTAMIVAQQMADNTAGNFAAKVCADYSVTDGSVTYGDWYLPSIYELNLMYLNIGQGNALGLGNVGGFASYSYWSSTENGFKYAWRQDFFYGTPHNYNKVNPILVRAVRAF